MQKQALTRRGLALQGSLSRLPVARLSSLARLTPLCRNGALESALTGSLERLPYKASVPA